MNEKLTASRNILAALLQTTPKKDKRTILKGVHADERGRLIATDCRKLMVISQTDAPGVGATIPANAVKQAIASASAGCPIEIAMEDGTVKLASGDLVKSEVETKPIDGTYPNVDSCLKEYQIAPKADGNMAVSIHVNVKFLAELSAAIWKAMGGAGLKHNAIEMIVPIKGEGLIQFKSHPILKATEGIEILACLAALNVDDVEAGK